MYNDFDKKNSDLEKDINGINGNGDTGNATENNVESTATPEGSDGNTGIEKTVSEGKRLNNKETAPTERVSERNDGHSYFGVNYGANGNSGTYGNNIGMGTHESPDSFGNHMGNGNPNSFSGGTSIDNPSPTGGYNDPSKSTFQRTPNAAELLNSYLFETGDTKKIEPPKKDSAALKKIWKTIGLLLLTITVVFSGAFACFYWVCETALFGDSDFFRTLMLKSSGVTVNKIEVDMISGSYEEDTIALAEKIRECSIDILLYNTEGERMGSGSGVILSEDGLAITNYHVVYGYETSMKAALSDGTVCKLTVVHLDKISDLAIVKIDTNKKLTPAKWGDSANLKAGQSIATCGNPLGLGSTVSFGKISHPDRDIGEVAGHFIQLDASTNPGNSGGGVYDAAGNLIGIVNSKASGTNVDGIGYAIPSSRALTVINDLVKQGYVSGRPAIGFTLVQVNESTWDYFNNGDGTEPGQLAGYLYEAKYGIYIIESKYNTNILKGDRIVSCDGVNFTNRDAFSQWLLKYKAGDKVSVKVERITNKTLNPDGSYTITREIKTFECTLGERNWADEPYAK